ncbi:MAG: hypothetical protein EA353_04910 [Puniceicoccaceae bacterium]|nr:MAG: hypothetical protein EA353_04910 [Puniceicoccaceae bacterium]
MMAGQLPKTCQCFHYGDDLPPFSNTFAHQFSRYAYHTTCSGKLHHAGPDQMQGWTTRVAADTELMDHHLKGAIKEEFARYTPKPGTGKWSNQREVEEARAVEGPHMKFDAHAVESALDYLERYFSDPVYQRPQAHRPLLFKLSLLQPHYPFFTDEERFAYYLDRVPLFLEKPCAHPVLSLSQQNRPVNVSEEAIRRATAAYYGMVDQVDTYFGQVMDKLEALGEDLDEWIIVYTSDHGEMLGEHGIWEKTRFYEASARVPLIIRWPKQFKPGVVNENVNLCDLYATLCDLAGLAIPDGLDSRSLRPLLEGKTGNWEDETISQFGKSHIMIKHGSLKYQYYGEDIPEVLFDLQNDPKETVNGAELPQYADAMQRFRKRLAGLGYGPKADTDYQNAGYLP